MNFNKNDLIDATLIRFYQTFEKTLDTRDFVPDKYNNKIYRYIYKNLKKAFRRINYEDRKYQQALLLKTKKKKSNKQKQCFLFKNKK